MPSSASDQRSPAWLLPFLATLFFFSGACALVYQVMWLRLLALVFGVTVYAASTVLAGFMAGLAVGSFAAGRLAGRLSRPLATFGAAEILVGLTAPTHVRRVMTLCTIALLVPAVALAQSTAGGQYEQMLAREKVVRAAAPVDVDALRSLAKSYERIVLRYPTSGYSDNALWQAAGLYTLAHAESGEAADRKEATRLLQWLKREYPSSSLIDGISAELSRLAKQAAKPRPRATPPPAPKPSASARRLLRRLPKSASTNCAPTPRRRARCPSSMRASAIIPSASSASTA